MSELQDWHPQGIDTTKPSPARMYDYALGGKDNFAVDREAAEQAFGGLGMDGRQLVLENRRFLGRAVRYLVAEAGIRQIIDLGTGLPTQENVHEVAHDIAPDTRVAYLDNDPIVIAHARALLEETNRDLIRVAEADMRHPDEILNATRGFIDFDQPVAVMFIAMLHFVSDEHAPHATVARIRDELAPGSYLALSHVEELPTTTGARDAYNRATAQAAWRPRGEIERFFAGFDLVEPGLVSTTEWHPDGNETHMDGILAGLGRKP